MVDQLRVNPDAGGIAVTVGDFATTAMDERYSLVYLVCNTITNLTTQDEQVAASATPRPISRPGATS